MTAPLPALRVFVVDDHPVLRKGIDLLLQQAGVRVVGSAAALADARAGIGATAPDVVLVDLALGEEDGRTLIRELARSGGPRPLVYSMDEEGPAVEESLALGALGYVTKGEVWDTLVTALGEVAAGRRYLSPRARRALDDAGDAGPEPGADLSARERDVFRLLGEGFAPKEIAARLDVGSRTVESYCARLQEKLRLAGMRELRRAAIAARRG